MTHPALAKIESAADAVEQPWRGQAMPKSGAFKTETENPTRADCAAVGLMFKRILALEFADMPAEYSAGPYWIKMDQNGTLTMGLSTAECLARELV
jgi:hypothetical protein